MLGVKVAVTADVPAPTTVAVLPLIEITDGDPEEYAKVPSTPPVTVGAVRAKLGFPNIFATPGGEVNVGFALSTVTVIVFTPAL